VERQTHRRGAAAQARAHDKLGTDPAVAFLVAVISVLLALALGTALFLMLPAAI
jgi:type IV secretory pathway component VirB8